MTTLGKPPEGVVMTPLSSRVFQVLAQHTAFPWAVMVAQCKRCDVDPSALGPSELKRVAPFLCSGVARFTSPEKGESVRRELDKLTAVAR
jgi:hypothetical protein